MTINCGIINKIPGKYFEKRLLSEILEIKSHFANDHDVIWWKSTQWKYFVEHSTDKDKNGKLTEQEVRGKYKEYANLTFKALDGDKNGLVTCSELASPSISMNFFQEVLDIALSSFPVESYLQAGRDELDKNKDGYIAISELEALKEILRKEGELPKWMTDAQLEPIRTIFHYLDHDNDAKISTNDIKSYAKSLVLLMFKFFDQNDDGHISLDDLSINVKFNEAYAILEKVLEPLKQGDIIVDMNLYLIPLRLDKNNDGVVNAVDIYLMKASDFDLGGFFDDVIPKLTRLDKKLDQNQDGKLDLKEIKHFLATVWNILDHNDDLSLSMDDMFNFLKSRYDLNSKQITQIQDYIEKSKVHLKEQIRKLAIYLIGQNDRNSDGAINVQELVDLRVPCVDVCFEAQGFSELPEELKPSRLFEDRNSPSKNGLGKRSVNLLGSIVDDDKLWTGN